jgi:hypothetical protein
MITGELKASVDRIWDAFWSGGIANPLEVMEQITYLLFIRRLDDLQTAKENRANRLGVPIEAPIFRRVTTSKAARTPISAGRDSRIASQARCSESSPSVCSLCFARSAATTRRIRTTRRVHPLARRTRP